MAQIRLNDPLRTNITPAGIIAALGTSGMLRVYGGTQPGTGGATAGVGEVIVQMTALSWNPATAGTAALAATKTGTAGTTGTATWARLSDTSGTAYIIDGDCGTGATCNFIISVATITAADVVTLNTASIIQPGS
jgi:hypothetical protein